MTDSLIRPMPKETDLVTRIRAANAIPTWEDAKEIVGAEPRPGYRPYLWSWDQMRQLLMEAGDAVTPERGAERRSIDHVNPTLPAGSLSTTHALGTAVQLVRPGEVAPAHRHAAAAIRFVLESGDRRIHSTVNGERLIMETGDLLLTPSMTWHDHHNQSDHDLIWFDTLDYPLVNYLRSSFFETFPTGEQPILYPDDYSAEHAGLVRPAFEKYAHQTPVLRYPWSAVEMGLRAARSKPPHPHHGYALTYASPFLRGGTLPTFGCYIQALPAGFRTLPIRTNASRAQVVVGGSGETVLDGEVFPWSRGDVLSIPPWTWVEHRNHGETEATFFYASEQPLIESLGLWRIELASQADAEQVVRSAGA
jgi:gentisate 1,2-dioxygenase